MDNRSTGQSSSKLTKSGNNSTSALMTPPTTPCSSKGIANNMPKNGRDSSAGSGPRLIVDFSDLTVPVPTTPRSLQPEELRRLFLVSLEKMITLEPESLPFRQPVDPEALGIPDYNDIIRKPMDLQTIRIKMNLLKYTDPWMYVDDVLLMMDNAWVYNRPASRIFHYCEKLSEIFQQEINPTMTRLGYRHGRIHQFNSQTLSCFGRPVCLIPRNATYYNFLRFHLCEKCYSANMQEDGIKLPWQNNVTVDKENFIKLHNDAENSYSPAAEMHRAYQRDAQMSRQLVIREFLKLLSSSTVHPDKKKNVRKMLRLNGQLRSEFVQYFHQETEAYLLTPTEVERIKQQLRIIEEGESSSNQPDVVQKIKQTNSSTSSSDSLDNNNLVSNEEDNRRHSRDDHNHAILDVDLEQEEEDVEEEDGETCGNGRRSSSTNNNNTSTEGDLDPGRSASNSHLLTGSGVELESSSGSSNCSTLSSLKSLN